MIEELTDDHIAVLAANLGPYAAKEVDSLDGDRAYHIKEMAQRSLQAWAIIVDGEPVAALGTITNSVMASEAMVWVVCSERAGRSFARHTKAALGRLLRRYALVWGWVDLEYPPARRWLEWLGFKPGETLEANGRVYRAYWMRAE